VKEVVPATSPNDAALTKLSPDLPLVAGN